MIIRCNLCSVDDKEAFRVPFDDAGIALMNQHLHDDHKVYINADIAHLERG